MRQARWAGLFLAILPLLAGCKGFWDPPTTGTNFALSNSGNISISPGAATGNTSTISATPSNSFTGTVSLTCSVSGPTNATSPATCSLSPTSVDITSSTAETATLTATTTASTTAGAYNITVSGSSGSETETTTVCAVVTSGTCSGTAGTSGIFYVLSASSIEGYTVSSGTLTSVSSSYTLSGASAIAIAPSGSFLYVASVGDGIVVYTINTSTGALTQGNTIISDSAVQAMQIDPSGKWLLDANLAGTITAYPISSTGAQDTTRTLQQVPLASATVQQMAISPSGALISVALGNTGTQSFSLNAASNTPIGTGGSLITKPYGSDGAAIAVAIDPQSRLLYVGETAAFNSNTNSGALRVFAISTNASGASSLTELAYASPYAPLGTGPHAILADPTGKYVYAASWKSGAAGVITGYTVTTSALTALSSTVATGTQPYGLAEDSTGSYVLAVSNQGSPLFSAYTFDATTLGQLDASATGSTISNPIAIVAVPKQ